MWLTCSKTYNQFQLLLIHLHIYIPISLYSKFFIYEINMGSNHGLIDQIHDDVAISLERLRKSELCLHLKYLSVYFMPFQHASKTDNG